MAAANELAHPIKQRLQAGDVALGMPVRLGAFRRHRPHRQIHRA